MATQLEVIRERIKTDLAELHRLEDEHFEQVELPAMRARIGFCFKYRNCYSCPQTEADYWWMYSKIVGVRNGSYRLLCFSMDCNSKLAIEESFSPSLEGYQPISHEGFLSAVTPMLNALRVEVEYKS